MTAESRKAIPGRSNSDDRNLDRLVFGDNSRDKPEKQDKPAEARERDIKVRMRNHEAANDDDADEAGPDPIVVEDISFVERAAKDRRRNTDRRRGYSRLPDERGNFGSENSKRGPMLAAIAIGVVLVFGALVWNMYRDGVKSEAKSVKPKAIAGGSYKSKPEDEAGADVDGAQVFDQVGAGAPGALDGGPSAAVVAPSAEPSVAPAAVAPPAPKAEAKPSPAPSAAAPKVEPPKAEAKPAVAPSPVVKAAPPPAPKVEAKAVAPKVAAPVVAAAPAPKADGFKPAFAAGGPYVVQLAALASEAEADTEWAKRAKSAPDLFGSAEKIVVKAEVNGKTVYRLRAGAFANSADAESFCAAFKARGGVCFRATR
jgi:hypothetical protein